MSINRNLLILLIIILIGSALRIAGADWGFPLLQHPDEWDVTQHAYEMLAIHPFDPNSYAHPNIISIYINAVIFFIMDIIRLKPTTMETFYTDINFYYLTSRIIVGVLGVISIYVAFLIGKEYNRTFGLILAVFFTFFPSFVLHSHYATPDIPLTLFIMIVILYSIKYLKYPSSENLLIMSLFSAISTVEKYPGALSFLMILTVVFISNYKSKQLYIKLTQAAIISIIFLGLFTLPLFFNFDRFIASIQKETMTIIPSAKGNYFENLSYYAFNYANWIGFLSLPLLIYGFHKIVKDFGNLSIPLFFGGLYWLVISILSLRWERWALPMYVTPLILTGYGIYKLHNHLKFRKFSIIIIGLVYFQLIVFGITANLYFSLEDTRNVAYDYFLENNITPYNSIYSSYTPFISAHDPRSYFTNSTQILAGYLYIITNSKENKEYYIISSYMYDRYFDGRDLYQEEPRVYETIFKHQLVKEFKPCVDQTPTWSLSNMNIGTQIQFLKNYFTKMECYQGPVIKVYRAE